MADPEVLVTAVEVRIDSRVAATVDAVDVGGGSQVVTVDGVPEERIHPSSRVFHVRFISPDRMLPDELREVDDYDLAVKLGVAYAEKLSEHADRLASLAQDLKV
jgi:hypothetical protein